MIQVKTSGRESILSRTGDDLRKLRESLQFTQEEIANQLNLARWRIVARESETDVPESWYEEYRQALIALDNKRKENLS